MLRKTEGAMGGRERRRHGGWAGKGALESEGRIERRERQMRQTEREQQEEEEGGQGRLRGKRNGREEGPKGEKGSPGKERKDERRNTGRLPFQLFIETIYTATCSGHTLNV